jgi:hypothetical protein
LVYRIFDELPYSRFGVEVDLRRSCCRVRRWERMAQRMHLPAALLRASESMPPI